MLRQHSCRAMYEILWRSLFLNRDESEARFPSNLSCDGGTVSETGPWAPGVISGISWNIFAMFTNYNCCLYVIIWLWWLHGLVRGEMWSQYINIKISSLLLWPIDLLLSDALLYFYDNKRILILILKCRAIYIYIYKCIWVLKCKYEYTNMYKRIMESVNTTIWNGRHRLKKLLAVYIGLSSRDLYNMTFYVQEFHS